MLTTQTNINAMLAQNQLANTQKDLTSSMQRLTTGLRINSAADDAAGMQIASRMTTGIGAMDVAMRNASDAISMAQTADGAMGETSGVLNRMRELSLQAANDTNNSQDRSALQAEISHLIDQVDTISKTEYAGIPVMSQNQTMSFQIGTDAGQTMNMSFTDLSASGLKGKLTGAEITGPLAPSNKLTLSAGNPAKKIEIDVSSAKSDEKVIDLINKHPAMRRLGVSAELKPGTPKKMELVGINLAKPSDVTLKAAKPAGDKAGAVTDIEKSVDKIDISTRAGAMQATKILNGALPQVDKQRAHLGAAQNRLEHAINNLQNTQENLTTSKSRITDADFAKETTRMTKNQMMMQAGKTVLAQAKQMPQYAVQLLGGN